MIFRVTGLVVVAVALAGPSCERQELTGHGNQRSAENSNASISANSDDDFMLDKLRTRSSGAKTNPAEASRLNRDLESLSEEKLRSLLNKIDWKVTQDREFASRLLTALSSKSATATLDAIAGIPEVDHAMAMPNVAYLALARREPQETLAWFQKNIESTSKHVHVAALFMLSELGKIRPVETIQMISRAGEAGKERYLPYVMRASAIHDPVEAMKLAESSLSGKDLDRALVAVLSVAAQNDPTAALSMLSRIPGSAKTECIKGMLPSLLLHDGLDIGDLVELLPSNEMPTILSQGGLVERLTSSAPDKAVALMDLVPFTEQNKNLYSRLALSLAESDPAKGLEFLRTLPIAGASKEIAGKLFERLAQLDPDSAHENIAGLPAEYQLIATRGVARAIAKEDLDAAFKMAEKADPSQRQDVYREVARQVTYSNPQDAVKLLEDPKMAGILGSGFRSEMLDHTVRGWTKTDLDAARSWVEKLPATDLPMGVQGLMNPWMKSDPVAASEWLARLPAGPARDAGARAIIEQVKNTDPEMAEQWRKSLPPQPNGQK